MGKRFNYQDLTYELNDNIAEATLVEIEKSGDVVIPETVDDGRTMRVTRISNYDYFSVVKTEITSINIPQSVTAIGRGAFYGCSALKCFEGNHPGISTDKRCICINGEIKGFAGAGITEYNIPESVTAIGEEVFSGCSSLTSINIPQSVTTIGASAFKECRSLTSINIPQSVTTIGRRAFEVDGKQMKNVIPSLIIPNGVINIEEEAFSGRKITKVYIPSSVQLIDKSAFTCAKEIIVYNDAENIKIMKTGNPKEISYLGKDATTESSKINENNVGLFSISENKRVVFAKGNLQYNAAKNIFRFAEHQWDYIGYVNTKRLPTYDGWIDLFGFGTSGYGGIHPYESSRDVHKYSPIQLISGTEYDWCNYNSIQNGGNKAGLWRTLTKEEWFFLIFERKDADKLRAIGSVNNTNGLIILPDNFYMGGKTIVLEDKSTRYEDNCYTAEQWLNLENLGAVFLPSAGLSYKDEVNYVEEWGSYWTSGQAFSDDEDFINEFYYYGNEEDNEEDTDQWALEFGVESNEACVDLECFSICCGLSIRPVKEISK